MLKYIPNKKITTTNVIAKKNTNIYLNHLSLQTNPAKHFFENIYVTRFIDMIGAETHLVPFN